MDKFNVGVDEKAPPIKEWYVIDDTTTPDNVLKYAIGEMETVSLCGKKKNGEWYFASSSDNPFEVIDALNRFIRTMKTHIEFDANDED